MRVHLWRFRVSQQHDRSSVATLGTSGNSCLSFFIFSAPYFKLLWSISDWSTALIYNFDSISLFIRHTLHNVYTKYVISTFVRFFGRALQPQVIWTLFVVLFFSCNSDVFWGWGGGSFFLLWHFGVARRAVLFLMPGATEIFGRWFLTDHASEMMMIVDEFFFSAAVFFAVLWFFEWFFAGTNRDAFVSSNDILVTRVAGGRFLKPGVGHWDLLRPSNIVTFLTCVWGGVLTHYFIIGYANKRPTVFEGRFNHHQGDDRLFAHPCSRPAHHNVFWNTFFACHI